jgi:hypothetical protein
MDLTRRELKYQIPLSMVEPISRYLENYCEMDKYSKLAGDGYYVINSLYLDSDRMLLLERKRANLAHRFSMRIRSYGMNAKWPAFMEIKSKRDLMMNKKRCAITNWDTVQFMRDGQSRGVNPDLAHPVLKTACYHILNLQLKPKIMTQYQRKAYFGLFDPYSRVTFDRRMRCFQESEYNLFPEPERFKNYDHADNYASPDATVVLELKCELKVPFWMSNLIRKFDLRQAQFSKYDSSWTFLTDVETAAETFVAGPVY